MASFVNNAVFVATSGGTGAFSVSAAATGYQTPAAAGASDSKTYRYRAYSSDLTQWEIGSTVPSSSATSFTRVVTASSAGGTTTVDFTNPPTVALSTVFAADLLQFDDAMSLTSDQKAQAQTNIGIREVLTADRDYAVASNGSDSNTGLSTASASAVTFTNGSANVGWTAHGRSVNQFVVLKTAGTLPTNFASQGYYIKTVVDANTVTLASTNGGTAITAGSAGSGSHTAQPFSPFLTPQKAMDVVAALDCSIYNVNIYCAGIAYSGTGYALILKSYLGAGRVSFIGDTVTPSNTTITSTNFTAIVTSADQGRFTLNGMRIAGQGAQDLAAVSPCSVTAQNMEYNGNSANYRLYCGGKCVLTISGSVHKFVNSTAGQIGAILAEQGGQLFLNSSTLTWTVSVTYSSATVTCRALGYIEAAATTCSIGAFTVTGPRYNVATNGVVNGTGSTTLFPGTTAGSTATGGQYA